MRLVPRMQFSGREVCLAYVRSWVHPQHRMKENHLKVLGWHRSQRNERQPWHLGIVSTVSSDPEKSLRALLGKITLPPRAHISRSSLLHLPWRSDRFSSLVANNVNSLNNAVVGQQLMSIWQEGRGLTKKWQWGRKPSSNFLGGQHGSSGLQSQHLGGRGLSWVKSLWSAWVCEIPS